MAYDIKHLFPTLRSSDELELSRAQLRLYRPRLGSRLWVVLRVHISLLVGPRLEEE